jgi:predicted transcriptional regulator
MSKDVTITARIESDLDERLAKLAKAQGRSKSWVIEHALNSFVTSELAFIEAVEVGLRDMREGRVVPHEDAVARFLARFDKP